MTIIIAAKIKLLDILRIDVGKRNGCYFKDYTFLPLESSSVLIPKNDLGATIGSLDMERIQDSNSYVELENGNVEQYGSAFKQASAQVQSEALDMGI